MARLAVEHPLHFGPGNRPIEPDHTGSISNTCSNRCRWPGAAASSTVRKLVVHKSEPVTIDARRHDAVLFDLDAVVAPEGGAVDSALTLIRRLHDVGGAVAVYSADPERGDNLASAGIGHLVVGDRKSVV